MVDTTTKATGSKVSAGETSKSIANSSKKSNVTEASEKNYETNCPPLYEAIETAKGPEDFDRVLDFLNTGKWTGSFFKSGETPEQQAKTWVTRFDKDKPTKVKWSQLPLHLAIVCGSPCPLIRKLVALNPQALKCTDDQHMLPLHLALRHDASDEIVAFLVSEFPEAVNAKGKSGRSAVDCALRANNRDRGIILENFVNRTKGRISSNVIAERQAMKKIIETKTNDYNTLHSELEAQYSVIEKLRKDLAKNKSALEEAKTNMTSGEQTLRRRIEELEKQITEKDQEAQEKIEKLESIKLDEKMELEKKVQALEAERKEFEMKQQKMQEEEGKLRKELAAVEARVATSVSPEDWKRLKGEIEQLQAEKLERERAKAKQEIEVLKSELQQSLETARNAEHTNSELKNELKKELKSLKESVDALQADDATITTSDQLQSLRDEVKMLRTNMKSQTEATKTKLELSVLKKAMEVELKNAEGKTQQEIDQLRKAIELAGPKDLEKKTAEELASVKAELETLKKSMADRELVTKTKKDAEELCEKIANEIEKANTKEKKDLITLKKSADSICKKMVEVTSSDDAMTYKKDIEALKDEYKNIVTLSKIHEEAAVVKKQVEEEIMKSQGKTQEELIAIKKAVKELTEKGLDKKKDAEELSKVKNELSTLKQTLTGIEEATKIQLEFGVLKKALEVQLCNTTGKTQKELEEMKKAVDAINLENKESKKLKKSLTEEIKQTNGKTEKELIQMKKALESMNIAKIESTNKTEWENIRKEMDTLRNELKEKQEVEMTSTEKELAAMKKVVEAINIKELETKNESEFGALRAELDNLRSELKTKEDGEETLKKAIEDLKAQARSLNATIAPMKKDKSSLKKFLSRRFSRKMDTTSTTASKASASSYTNTTSSRQIDFSNSVDSDVVMTTTGVDDTTNNNTAEESEVVTILPPSLSNGGDNNNDSASVNPSSSDDSVARFGIQRNDNTREQPKVLEEPKAEAEDQQPRAAAAEEVQRKAEEPVEETETKENVPTNKEEEQQQQSHDESKEVVAEEKEEPVKEEATKKKFPFLPPTGMKNKKSKMKLVKSKSHVPPPTSEPLRLTRTMSKTVIQNNGEVELEAFEDDGDVIGPPSMSADENTNIMQQSATFA